MRASPVTAIVLAVSLVGCASTRYMGPVPSLPPEGSASNMCEAPREPVVPIARPGNSSGDPRMVAVTSEGTTFELGHGQRVLLPHADQFTLVEKEHGTGAIEGLVTGTTFGLIIGAIVVAKNDCSPGAGCVNSVPGVFLLTGLLSGAIGALYGATVGHTTTYRWGPAPTTP